MQDVYKNIDEYNPGKNRKALTIFDDLIADIINNKKLKLSNRTTYQRKKTKHFSCFYYAIIR